MGISEAIGFERGVRFSPKTVPTWLLSLLGAVLLVVGWHYGSEFGIIDDFLMPPPAEVWAEFYRLRSLIAEHLGITLFESAVGFFVAVTLSIVLGIVITMDRRVYDTLMPLIIGGNSIPRIALAPLFIFYFGGGSVAKFIIAAWIAFFPMLINTVEGLSLQDEERQMMLDLLDATTWQEYRHVRFPNALPHLFDGMKLAVSLAIIGAIVGEFIAANEGLGALVVWALWNHNIGQALAIVLVMGTAAALAIVGLYLLQNRLVFWREATMFGGSE